MSARLIAAALAAAVWASGCAFVPKANQRLDEARAAHAAAAADPAVKALAPDESRRATLALEEAIAASGTLQDSAVIDHLAYLSKQRVAIAREVAKMRAAQATAAALRRDYSRP